MLQFLYFILSIQNSCQETEGLRFYTTDIPWEYFKGENISIQLILPIFAFLAACFLLWEFFLDKRKIGKYFSNNLKYFAFWILLAGFILYFIGYSHQIKGIDGWMILGSTIQAGFRALMSSLGMFVFDTDFIEISEAYHHNIWYLIAFSLVHLLGILVTTHVILRLLGERFLSSRRMSRILNKSNKRDIFVFWGINEESITLAESIKEKYNNHKKEEKDVNDIELLFVETPSEKELEIKEHSLSHFFNSSFHGSSEKERIATLNGTVLYPRRRLIDVDKELSNKTKNKQPNNEKLKPLNKGKKIFEKLGLSKMFKLCNLPYCIHFFFLSDDEQKNIQDTLIIQSVFSDKALSHELNLYCKSRDNYANRAIINAENLFVTKIIDEASLSINTLKEMTDNKGDYVAHPINFVDPDKDNGTARKPFTALIIGFGTAGQDTLRFLYEYGSFVRSSGVESPFKCYVIDKNMDNIKGQFFREVPALESKEKPESMQNIEFWNNDWNSERFKEKFTREMLNRLNYVVIATGEDRSNTTIAAELYEYALKNREKGVCNFHIFIRVYKKEDEEQMVAVSKFYEENDKNCETISVFGKLSDIYTYQNIIKDEEKENNAKEFFETYLKIAGYNDSWAKREQRIKDKNTEYNQRLKDVHQRNQDYSNVLHKYTKLKLCKYLEEDMPYMKDFSFDINSYPEKDKQRMACYRNLSELEHLRWNAAHYMAGFLYAEEKNFRKKTHPLLKPFKKLEPDSEDKDDERLKDYATVFTTIELNKKNPIVEFQS